MWHSLLSLRQVKKSPGNSGAAVLNDAKLTFWTKTAWKDEPSMKAFLRTGPHLTAMKKLPNWCDEAALVHWIQESDTLPGWKEAHRRMQSEGRRSKVTHPSPAHEAFEIPEPKG
jgi:hypothetical protein